MPAPFRAWQPTGMAVALAAASAAAAQVAPRAPAPAPGRGSAPVHSGMARSIPTQAESLAVLAFVDSLQTAVRRDDPRAVARLVAYAPPARI